MHRSRTGCQPFAALRALAAVIAGAMLLATVARASADTPVDARQVKSAFIYNFAKFTEWPAESLGGSDLVIGVLGDALLATELEALVRGRQVNARSIRVVRVHTAEEARRTQVLFVSAEGQAQFATMRAEIGRSPVLTVGESPAFAAAGGAICFVQEGDKLRFEINIAAAERARLKISAHLQKLAQRIRREP